MSAVCYYGSRLFKSRVARIFDRLRFVVTAGVNGYSGDVSDGYLPSKRYSKIVTPDFPERFAVISRLKKETFNVGPRGLVMKSSVVPQVQVSVPEGAVAKDTNVTMQVGWILACWPHVSIARFHARTQLMVQWADALVLSGFHWSSFVHPPNHH